MAYPLRAWLAWLLASLFYLYEFIFRLAPSVMVPELMYDFGASASNVGTFSAFYFYAYAAFQIPVGLLFDKYGVRYLLSFACLIVAVGNIILTYTDYLGFAYASRALVGLGSAFAFAGCLKLCTYWFKIKHFSLFVGLTNFLGVGGALIGGEPWSIWIINYGWRDTVWYTALIGIALSLLLLIGVRDGSIHNDAKSDYNFNIKKLFEILKSNQIWIVALYGCFMVAPIAGFSELWGPAFLMEKYTITKSLAASITSATFLGIAIGGPFMGHIASKNISPKRLMLYGNLGALLSMLFATYGPTMPYLFLRIWYFIFGFSSSAMLFCFALNTAMVPKQMQGTIVGFTNMIVMAGSVILQPLIGILLDFTHSDLLSARHYQYAFLLLPVCHLSALWLWCFIKKSYLETVP